MKFLLLLFLISCGAEKDYFDEIGTETKGYEAPNCSNPIYGYEWKDSITNRTWRVNSSGQSRGTIRLLNNGTTCTYDTVSSPDSTGSGVAISFTYLAGDGGSDTICANEVGTYRVFKSCNVTICKASVCGTYR